MISNGKLIGKGTFGEVRAVEYNGRQVALKMPVSGGYFEKLESMWNEAEIIRELSNLGLFIRIILCIL